LLSRHVLLRTTGHSTSRVNPSPARAFDTCHSTQSLFTESGDRWRLPAFGIEMNRDGRRIDARLCFNLRLCQLGCGENFAAVHNVLIAYTVIDGD
jgi:hypothetical protein